MIRSNPFVSDPETFVRGYLECALWSSNDPDTEDPLDNNFSISDIEQEWLEVAEEDCNAFIRQNGWMLKKFGELIERDDSYLGHDFWLTRNHHGTGYWDSHLDLVAGDARVEAEKLGKKLTEACRAFGELDLMPIGDGRIGA